MTRSDLDRRGFLALAGAAALVPLSGVAEADADYPARPVRIICPFAPGGSGDITARLFGEYFKSATGQTAVVENRAGANGAVGAAAVKNSAPDGYTLLLSTNSVLVANELLYNNLPYARADLTTVGIFGSAGIFMLCQPGAPYRSASDFIAAAKARPGEMLSPYFNTSSRLASGVFAARAGIKVTEVPYKDVGQAVTDLISGRISIMFMDAVAAAQHMQAGTLRAIGVTTKERAVDAPDVPAVAETLPGFEVISFLGLSAPAKLPDDLRTRLNAMVNACIADPRIGGKFAELGLARQPRDLAAVDSFLATERARWTDYVRVAGIEKE